MQEINQTNEEGYCIGYWKCTKQFGGKWITVYEGFYDDESYEVGIWKEYSFSGKIVETNFYARD